MKRIFLSNSGFALVDNEDYLTLAKYQWYRTNSGYAIAYIDGKMALMHRLLMKTPKGKQTDHINENKLDNQKKNLRNCSQSQNMHRSNKAIEKTSRFIGVSLHARDKLWRTRLQHKVIGYFKDEHSAAVMHDFWAIERFGEFANTNFKVVSHN